VRCGRDRRGRIRGGAGLTPPISRRAARRSALTLLYQWDVTERALGELYEGEIDEYAQTVSEAIVRDAAELDRRITEAAAESGWTADRLGAVERNILRIAIHELDAGEIPARVVIDEAVTLAKQYSTREAGRLVNGILDRIYKEAA
jgi:transcription antitermination protein NusB